MKAASRKLFLFFFSIVISFLLAQHAHAQSWHYSAGGPPENFNAIWGASDTDIFAIGNEGKIVHYDGTSWSVMDSGIISDLYTVWGSSGTDVFASGEEGKILHYDGTFWSQIYYSEKWGGITCIWGTSATNVFAVVRGAYYEDVILIYDGLTWSVMDSLPSWSFISIWGSSATDIFTVGYAGNIQHFDGASWSESQSPEPDEGHNLYSIWGNSGTDVFAVGGAGTIMHYDGISWSNMDSGIFRSVLYSVWGTSHNNVYAVGEAYTETQSNRGVLLHYDGSTWSEVAIGTTEPLAAVWGTSADSVYVAGGRGYIYIGETNTGLVAHYDGLSWTIPYYKEKTYDPAHYTLLYDVWGSSPCNVFAVGSENAILHYNGASWSAVSEYISSIILHGIWGSSANDIFVVGEDYHTPLIMHYNGRKWRYMDINSLKISGGGFRDVWGSSATDIFAVGGSYEGSIIMHYNGQRWTPMGDYWDNDLYSVWGSSETDVYAVGEGGIVHYDGSTWSQVESFSEWGFYGVWGSSATDVFAVGGGYLDGIVAHYDGTAWSRMDIEGLSSGLESVWGSSATDVYAAGSETIFHYDGTSWSESLKKQHGFTFSMWGTSATDVFAVGSNIFHYSNDIDHCACQLLIYPSKINKLLSIVNPIQGFVLIGDTNAGFVKDDKPQWSTDAIKPLGKIIMVGTRTIIALAFINAFELEPGKNEVTVGNCTGTVEVKKY